MFMSDLLRVDLPRRDAHFFVMAQLHGVYDLVVVCADVTHQLLVLPVLAQQSFDLACN